MNPDETKTEKILNISPEARQAILNAKSRAEQAQIAYNATVQTIVALSMSNPTPAYANFEVDLKELNNLKLIVRPKGT